LGPIHIHGSKIKVGKNIDLKIVPDKITKDEDKDKKDIVVTIKAHRKGDSDDTFTIKVEWKDLDDKSKELLKELKEDKIYEAKLEKRDDDWKLIKIRKIDEE
jgi:hypothetical protein